MMTVTIDDASAPVTPAVSGHGRTGPWAVIAVLVVAVAIVGVMAAERAGAVAGDWVRFVLIGAWAGAGVATIRLSALHRLGRLLLCGSALGAAAFAAAGEAATGSGGLADVCARLAPIACLLLIALSGHVVLSLPDGRLGTRARVAGAAAIYAAAFVVGVTVASGPNEVSVALGATAWAVVTAVTLPAAHRRYLASAGLVRQRLQWLGSGATAAGEIALATGSLYVLVHWPTHAGAIAALGTAAIPIAMAASTNPGIAQRIDRVLFHTVSLVGVTFVVIAVYVVIVLGLGPSPTSDEHALLGLSMIAAAVATIAYRPARERLNDVANRLVYGERSAPDEALRSFGQRLTRAMPMEELLLQLAESLRKTMTLTSAEIWTGGGDVLERAVSVPDAGPARLVIGERERSVVARAGVSGNAWISVWLPALLEGRSDRTLRVAPITHSATVLGLIVVERSRGGDAFTEEDERVLTELSRQVGLALHNVQLDSALQASLDEVRRQAEELRASRTRIVAAADAERRNIERNLHDGAQQHLVALAVNLRLTRDMVTDDPGSAAEMLDALATEVKDTIQELRDLAHGIYPPLLRDSGVVAALRAAANRSPLAVGVQGDGVGRYPTEVEAAVYFCCLEALQNAGKHAPGANVEVRLWEDQGGLLFSVSDDGPGFDAATAEKGHGYTNMSDRLGAIGGSVRWESRPGRGATVTGAIPLGGVSGS